MNEQRKLSIHPRNWQGGNREKRNTSATPNAARIQKVIKSIQKHLERHPNDKASEAHIMLLEKRLG